MVKSKVIVKGQEFVGFPTDGNFKFITQEVDDNLSEGGIFQNTLYCLMIFVSQTFNQWFWCVTFHIISQSSSLKPCVLDWILTHGKFKVYWLLITRVF